MSLRGGQELASDPCALAATLSGLHKPPVGPGGRAGPGRGVRTPARQRPCRPAKRVSPGGFCSSPSGDLSFARPPLTAGWMSIRFLAVFGSCFCFVLGAHVTGAKGVGGHCPCWCPHQADRRSPRGGPGRQHFWVLSSPDCIGRTHTRVAHVSVVPAPQAGEGLGLRPVVSRSAEASGSVWASPGSFPPSPRFLGQRSEPQSPHQRTETRPGPHHPPPCGPGGACASRHRPAGVVMEFCFL